MIGGRICIQKKHRARPFVFFSNYELLEVKERCVKFKELDVLLLIINWRFLHCFGRVRPGQLPNLEKSMLPSRMVHKSITGSRDAKEWPWVAWWQMARGWKGARYLKLFFFSAQSWDNGLDYMAWAASVLSSQVSEDACEQCHCWNPDWQGWYGTEGLRFLPCRVFVQSWPQQ